MSDSPSLFERILRPLRHNEVTTREPGHYPELESRTYAAASEEVFAAVRDVVEVHEQWDIVEADSDARRLAFEATTRWMGFVDDVTVEIEETDGESVVHVRSASRVGEGDLGKNVKRVRELFERLEATIG